MTTPQEPLLAPQLPFSAVFVDLENMAINPDPDHPTFDLALVMKQVRFLSNPIVRMGFADWSKLPQFARSFVLQGFDQIQATYVTGSKNSADMQLCVDALEVVLMRKEIQAVFLVSGDADFTPLARAIRRQGRQVIGIGWRDKVSVVFRRSCDRFFAYEELPGLSIDEASELSVADRRAERRLASQQTRRSVAAFRPGTRTGGKTRRRSARAEQEDAGPFLADPRDAATESAAPTAAAETQPERREPTARHERPERVDDNAEPPEDPIAKLRMPPIGFLGGDQQFAVLEALHRELSEQSAPRRRNQIVNAVAQKLAPMRRAQVAAVERILWHAKVYDVVDRAGQRSSVLWNVQLRAKNRDFDALRAAHDIQLIADAAEAGLFLAAADWSEQFYGGPEDADVIEDYFREVAGISSTFAKATGIVPAEHDESEAAAADDSAADDSPDDQPSIENKPPAEADGRDDEPEGPAAAMAEETGAPPLDETLVETVVGTSVEMPVEAAGPGPDKEEPVAEDRDAAPEDDAPEAATADDDEAPVNETPDAETPVGATSSGDEPDGSPAPDRQTGAAMPEDDRQPALFGDSDAPAGADVTGPGAAHAGAETVADGSSPAARSGWWSRL